MGFTFLSRAIFVQMDQTVFKTILGWIRKYKILHILFWYYYWNSMLHTLLQHSMEKNTGIIYHNSALTILFQILTVYTILYVLLPRLYFEKKYLAFAVSVPAVVLALSVLNIWVTQWWIRLLFAPKYHLNFKIVFIGHTIDTAVLVFIFLLLYLAEYYYLRDKRNTQKEKERLQTELHFLKAQLNPHFLFNTLNSLHVIMKEDLPLAERTLLEFSALLRYQLYECNEDITTLEREVEFLKNYVALEQLRHGEALQVDFQFPQPVPYRQIAPFMLIPFVENAFKHVSHHADQPNRIRIELIEQGGKLQLTIENTCEPQPQQESGRKGIGTENALRRLALLYPKHYHLVAENRGNTYYLYLQLDLNGDQLHHR